MTQVSLCLWKAPGDIVFYRGLRDFRSKILEVSLGKGLVDSCAHFPALSRCEALGVSMSRLSLGPDLPVKLDSRHSSMAV